MSRKNKNALIFFIKAPRLGFVKTRLQPELTPEQSVLLYRAMVEDTVRQFADVEFCDVKIFFYPADARKEMKAWLGDQFDYFPQHGNDLGERMCHAIAEMLNQRYEKVVLVGSDIPTLGVSTVERSFVSLDENDLVIGPCEDGGYYLIGMKREHPELFQGINWSTCFVFQQTMQTAQKAELKIMQMELKSDIDTSREVEELWDYLSKRNMGEGYFYRPKTYSVLKGFFATEMKLNYHKNKGCQ